MEVLWATQQIPFYGNFMCLLEAFFMAPPVFAAPLLWKFYVDFYGSFIKVLCTVLWQFYGIFMARGLWQLYASS